MNEFEMKITSDFTIDHAIQTIERIDNNVVDILNSSKYGSDEFKKAQRINNSLRRAYLALQEAKEEFKH